MRIVEEVVDARHLHMPSSHALSTTCRFNLLVVAILFVMQSSPSLHDMWKLKKRRICYFEWTWMRVDMEMG